MKHKYNFYFYPVEDEKHGKFRIFSTVREGKRVAEKLKRKYDYQKKY